MEMEDKDSTESGSSGGNSESDSPPSSGGAYGGQGVAGVGGMVVPEVINMGLGTNMEKNAVVNSSPAVVGGGGVIGGGGGGGIISSIDGAGLMGAGGGSGELAVGKKKRGRPRKYDADGNLNPAYLKSPPAVAPPQGFTLSTPPSYEYSSGSKRGRGKHTGSGNFQILASLGELFVNSAGGDFTPHVVTVYTGEDVAGKILTFAQKGLRGICVLSANGCVSNVTLRQPGSSGGLLTYEGRFEILTLTGSFTVSDNGGIKSRTGGLSVSLASPDGRVIGGGVAGLLMAASPIQIVMGSFVPYGFNNNNIKVHKKRQHAEHRPSPTIQHGPPPTVTAAVPISHAAPATNIYNMPASQLPLPVQSHGGAADHRNNRVHLNSASTDTADWNGSGPSLDQYRPSPDINVPVSLEEH